MFRHIARHWRGEQALVESFWLNVVLVDLVLFALAMAAGRTGLLAELGERADIERILVIAGGLLGAGAALTVWQIVGTWRAAARRFAAARAGWRGQIFPLVVQIALVGFVVWSLPAYVNLGRASVELGLIAFERDAASGFAIAVSEGELQLQGFVSYRAAREMENYLAYNPNLTLVALDSGGGRVGPALRVAERIAARRLDTFVERDCASACTLLFLAGEARVLDLQGRLGFHRARPLQGLGPAGGKADQATAAFLAGRGVRPDFIARVGAVAPDEMWYPPIAELFAAGVITHVYDGEGLLTEAEWRAAGGRDPRAAATTPQPQP